VDQRARIIEQLEQELDRPRFKHTLGVEKTALALAKKFKVSQKKASLAALLHDCARKYDRPGLLKQARKFKIKIDAVSRQEPKLLHAELSARMARRDFGIKDPEVLSAIRNHTLGQPGMSRLDQVIFLADHIEEGRDFAGVRRLRRLAAKDLDQAMVASTAHTIKYLLERKLPIHPASLKTRNYYLLNT
jgi:predicted HD superfamily hydrolase involved in NAD metabolism